MILDAAEIVLGFERSVYGNPRKKGNKKWYWWLEELREKRTKDIRTEMS
jgi:hypothetical protein